VTEVGAFPRPTLVVSRCLGFDPVRYNGQIVRDDFVQRLAVHCETVVVCPEVEIGLGVPRPPIRIELGSSGAVQLVQPETGRDLTAVMKEFAADRLDGLGETDGFLLKSRSPSCGFRDVKLYPSPDATQPTARRAGLFAEAVLARFPSAAIDDEGRLRDGPLRERFLTLLFALARLRAVEAGGERAGLVDFHARYKYVLMAYEERGMRELGRIVAAVADGPWAVTIARYRERFARAFARPARRGGQINALQHAFGPLSEGLGGAERAFFLEQVEELRAGRAPLTSTLTLLRSWALRFGNEYLERQVYLQPYPRELAG
jgi:uncharacterized protein YbgA (DUF1722 family)/uncharacterized protein YbbK (DUF523 family)